MVTKTHIAEIKRRAAFGQEFAVLWEKFFKCFGTGDLLERKITPEEDDEFEALVMRLATNIFRLSTLLGDHFDEGDKIIDILERAESITVIQNMAEANLSKLEIDWHNVFLSLHRAIGLLRRELPPEEQEKGMGEKPEGAKLQATPSPAAAPAPQAAPATPRVAPAAPKLAAPKLPPRPPKAP